MFTTFLIPNAMVYASKVLSWNFSSWASPSTQEICLGWYSSWNKITNNVNSIPLSYFILLFIAISLISMYFLSVFTFWALSSPTSSIDWLISQTVTWPNSWALGTVDFFISFKIRKAMSPEMHMQSIKTLVIFHFMAY